jgi:hypothetical protein
MLALLISADLGIRLHLLYSHHCVTNHNVTVPELCLPVHIFLDDQLVNEHGSYARSDVLMAMTMKKTVFWDLVI